LKTVSFSGTTLLREL